MTVAGSITIELGSSGTTVRHVLKRLAEAGTVTEIRSPVPIPRTMAWDDHHAAINGTLTGSHCRRHTSPGCAACDDSRRTPSRRVLSRF